MVSTVFKIFIASALFSFSAQAQDSTPFEDLPELPERTVWNASASIEIPEAGLGCSLASSPASVVSFLVGSVP